MARYGSFKYGQAKYGASPDTGALLWTCQMDWDRDGLYDRNESPWLQDVLIRRGREVLTRTEALTAFATTGVGFEMPSIGEAVIYLDNEDGRYDVYNASSPLYPNLRPGVLMCISVTKSGVTKNLFAGKISEIAPKENSKQVMMRAVDGLQEMGDREVSVALQTARRVDLAMGDLLDAMDWPTIWGRNLDNLPDYLAYFWAGGMTARSILRDLADASCGIFFVSGSGAATFRNRYRNDTPAINLTQAELGKDISVRQPWDVVFNRITVTVHPRTVQALGELWRLPNKPSVAPGETLEVWAEFTSGGESAPASSVAAITAAADYMMNTAEDGSGTSLTTSFSVTVEPFAQTAKLTLVNNAADPGFVTLLKLRGTAVTTSSVQVVAEDPTSQALYGVRDFALDNLWIQDLNTAQALAAFLLLVLATPGQYLSVTLENQFALQFPELFEFVGLSVPAKNINATGASALQVGYIEHAWADENGQAVRTILRLETPIATRSTLWIFPTQIGVTSILNF